MSIRNGNVFVLAMILVATANSISLGMIRGDKGNTPMTDPGWPKGAAKIVNSPNRIAWYEDPPFGGGRWHSECQGDNEKLSQVILDLANTESVKKRITVHSGNINQENWIEFKNVTPGKYLVYGQPNPGSTREKTKTIEVEIVGGKALEIELQANDGSSK